MEIRAFSLQIDPADVEEYQKRHDQIDPELEAHFQKTGVLKYKIFFREDGVMFAYMEVTDDHHELSKNAGPSPANSRWQKFMSDILKPVQEDKLSLPLREVYSFKPED